MKFIWIITSRKTHTQGGGGGTRKNFDRDARVTYLGLKFDNLFFFWSTGNLHYFFGLLSKETTELLPRNIFPLNSFAYFLRTKMIKFRLKDTTRLN